MTEVTLSASPVVLVLWWVAVGLALLVIVPLALLLLHRTLRASLAIRRFAEEALEAGRGILENVGAVDALDGTVEAAAPLVPAGARLRERAAELADVLGGRREGGP